MYRWIKNMNAREFLHRAKDTLECHWQELGINKDKYVLRPDPERYTQLQEAGVLHNLVVLKEDRVIGYSVILTTRGLHYQDAVFSQVDVLYVHPDFRSTSVGARLLVGTEELAKEVGGTVVLHHAKPFAPQITKPLEKMGYTQYELIYGKYIGD
jgi:GNAT superfamily N-acetyltransferase